MPNMPTNLHTYIYSVPTMSNNFYPITSNIWGLFWTPPPTLKLDVIYGRSHGQYGIS